MKPTPNNLGWSKWQLFPDPRKAEILKAPYGPGVYELRRSDTKEYILRGKGKNCASRISSILPLPHGASGRNNSGKRIYVLKNLKRIEYRTHPCLTDFDAKQLERQLHQKYPCKFPT